ncbi:MAG TPA: LysR family transcriptional regulator [Chitinophagaceae bacterium]|nr:LysR family transcriptional regulator [Chitinophagaceae bacterium]
MDYTLNQLRIFLKVAQTGSITRAAEELNLSQPAVSIQLRNFQRQFEIPLTEFLHKRLYITDFGKEIALAAENILQEAYAINYKSHQYKGQLSGRLRISVVSTGKYVMPYFLTGFLQLHTGVELALDVTNRARVLESLQQNEIDFALISLMPAPGLAIEKEALIQNRLYLVGNQSVTQDSAASPKKMLEQLPLIFRESGSATRMVMEQFIEKKQWPVQKKMVLTSNEAVKQAVLAGLGFAVMPLIGIRNELENGQLRIIPVKGLPIRSEWNLVWLSGKKLSPVALAYLNHLRNEKNSIIQDHFRWVEDFK